MSGAMVGSCFALLRTSPGFGRIRHRMPSGPHDSCAVQPGACELLEVSDEELGLVGCEIRAGQVSRLHPEIAFMVTGGIEQVG